MELTGCRILSEKVLIINAVIVHQSIGRAITLMGTFSLGLCNQASYSTGFFCRGNFAPFNILGGGSFWRQVRRLTWQAWRLPCSSAA
jgi:hypothetical protein